MTNSSRKPRLIRLRVIALEATFEFDDETPSLPGMRVYDADSEEISQVRAPGLAKCGAAKRLRAAGGK